MCDYEVDARECLLQRDFLFNEQVGALSLEALVRLLLHDDDDVAGLLARILVCLSVERVLAIVRGALINCSIDNFLLLGYLFTLACLALVGLVDNLALSIALFARALTLRVHARSQLLHLGDDTSPTTWLTFLNGALFTSQTSACLADAFPIDGNLRLFAIVDLFECALERMHHGFSFLGSLGSPGASTTSKHLTEQVVHATGVRAALFDAIFAILVVEFALFTVGEHLVRTLNLLELVLVATTVGMVRPSQLMVSFFDRVEVSLLVNSQDLIELFIVDFFRWTAPATTHTWHIIEASKWKAPSASSKEHILLFCVVFIVVFTCFLIINLFVINLYGLRIDRRNFSTLKDMLQKATDHFNLSFWKFPE